MPPRLKNLLHHLAHRGDILICIRDGMFYSREIADQVDKSRSTVDRNLRLLKGNDFIQEYPDKYELTKLGEYAIDLYELAEPLGRTAQFIPFLPSSVPITLLHGATIRESGGTVPQRPIDHVENLISAADQVQIITPAVVSSIVHVLYERMESESSNIELIVGIDVLNELLSTYSKELNYCLERDNCMIWKTDEELSFGLVITDNETMSLGVYDDSMRLLGTITNNSEDAIDWALDTFNEFRYASDEVFLRHTTSRMEGLTTV